MEHYFTQRFTDPKQLDALSDEQLEEALTTWQHALTHFQGCLVSTAMDLGVLQQEQARRRRLAETFGPKEGETQKSEPTQEGARVLSLVRPPQ